MSAPRRAQSEGLRRLLRTAREAGDGAVAPARDRAQKERMLAAVAHRAAFGERRGSATRRWALVGAALVAAAALVLWLRAAAPLGFAVEGAVLAEGGWLSAAAAPATLRFDDGTRVVFEAGAQGRVSDVDPRGARLVLEGGRLHLDVVPGRGGRWSVQAGPFVVEVTGTVFDVEWSAAKQALEVRMEHGSVRVRGPLSERGVDVVAGQVLRADLASQQIVAAASPSGARRQVASEAGEGSAPTGVDPAQGMPSGHGAAALATAAPGGSAVPSGAGHVAPSAPGALPTAAEEPSAAAAGSAQAAAWSARVAAGDFAGVVADAQARGVDAVLSSNPLADLVALADAARYAGSRDLARRALQAQRSRFPGSGAARAAAFLLGRLAEDRGSAAEALSFYDVYLAESPQGGFAAEALGRKMVAVSRGGNQAAAATLADEYLRRFPAGPYAGNARDIAGAPR